MCLLTKYKQESMDNKLDKMTFPIVMWKAMKISKGIKVNLIGVYLETEWCRYKSGMNKNLYPKKPIDFFKRIKGCEGVCKNYNKTYKSGFHAFFKKGDAEALADWIEVKHNRLVRVVPIIVKRKDILHIGGGLKRGLKKGLEKEKYNCVTYKRNIPVAVVSKFSLKKKEYEKAIRTT